MKTSDGMIDVSNKDVTMRTAKAASLPNIPGSSPQYKVSKLGSRNQQNDEQESGKIT